MTLTITPISNRQWSKVLRVAFWVVLSSALGILTAYLSKNDTLLASAPAYNVVLFALSQIFQQEESKSEQALPAIIKPEVMAGVNEVTSETAATRINI